MVVQYGEDTDASLEFIHIEIEKIEQLYSPYDKNFNEEELGQVENYLEEVQKFILNSRNSSSISFFQKIWDWVTWSAPYVITGIIIIGALILGSSFSLAKDSNSKKELKQAKKLKTIYHDFYSVFDLSWGPHGKYFAYGRGSSDIHILDKKDSNTYGFKSYSDDDPTGSAWLTTVKSVAWNPTKNFVALTYRLSSYNQPFKLFKNIMIYEVKNSHVNKSHFKIIGGHTDEIFSLKWSPDGKFIASASADKTIRIKDFENLSKPAIIFKGHTDQVYSIDWSPNKKFLASGSQDKTVKIWDVNGPRKKPITLRGHTKAVRSVDWSPNGKFIVSASEDKALKIWDVSELPKTPKLKMTLTGHKSAIHTATWSPDGHYMASGSAGSGIKIWKPLSTSRKFLFDIKKDKESDSPYGNSTLNKLRITTFFFGTYGKHSPVKVITWDPTSSSSNGYKLVIGTMLGEIELWSLTD